MTIEQMLEKLERDKEDAERVRKECYLKTYEMLLELKEGFYLTGVLDDTIKRKYDSLACQERMACAKLESIVTAIDEIKKRL